MIAVACPDIRGAGVCDEPRQYELEVGHASAFRRYWREVDVERDVGRENGSAGGGQKKLNDLCGDVGVDARCFAGGGCRIGLESRVGDLGS